MSHIPSDLRDRISEIKYDMAHLESSVFDVDVPGRVSLMRRDTVAQGVWLSQEIEHKSGYDQSQNISQEIKDITPDETVQVTAPKI